MAVGDRFGCTGVSSIACKCCRDGACRGRCGGAGVQSIACKGCRDGACRGRCGDTGIQSITCKGCRYGACRVLPAFVAYLVRRGKPRLYSSLMCNLCLFSCVVWLVIRGLPRPLRRHRCFINCTQGLARRGKPRLYSTLMENRKPRNAVVAGTIPVSTLCDWVCMSTATPPLHFARGGANL